MPVPSAARSSLAVCGPNLMASVSAAIDPLRTLGVVGVGPQHGDGVAGAGLDADMARAGGEAEHQQRMRPVPRQKLRQFAIDRLVRHRKNMA